MTLETIIEELKFCYGDKLDSFMGGDINLLPEDEIRKKFNEHCEKNKISIPVYDLFEKYQETNILINTPDGYNEIGDLYIKKPRDIYNIKLVDGDEGYSSCDHLFETPKGWIKAEKLSNDDFILTKKGFQKIKTIRKTTRIEEVYDFEVLHPNHRYWSGDGLSSHNSGKSFLALSICREAQKKGYSVIYLDSEASISPEFVERLGVDPKNFVIVPVVTIQETANVIANLVKSFKEEKEKTGSAPKVILVLDSLGNLSSDKEVEDMIAGDNKVDLTRQRLAKGLFRANGNELAKLKIPYIVTTHTYDAIGSYVPSKTIAGGEALKYNASVILELSTSKLDDKESEDKTKQKNIDAVKTGVIVTCKPIKQRFCKPIKVKFQIPFYKKPNPYVGLEPYINWDSCGIMRGKCLTEKEYNKLSDSEKETCKKFELNGELFYGFPKETARTIVSKRLGERPLASIFTDEVITDEVLKELDENVIKPTFQLPNNFENDDIDEMIDNVIKDN